MDLPDLGHFSRSKDKTETKPVFTADDLERYRGRLESVLVAPAVREYLVDLVRATRKPADYGLDLGTLLEMGASPRATIALTRASKANALLRGRDYVTPFDVKSIALEVLRHRILISYEADAEGFTADDVLQRFLDKIPVP